MDVRHLRYLLAVRQHRSFAAAARSLGISQQALGQSVASLEAELGVKLFERGAGGEPTVFGRALLKHAAVVDIEIERALSALGQLREASAGEVHVGVGEGFAGVVAPLAISWMHARSPSVKIHVLEDYTKTLLERLRAGTLDFVAGAPAAHPSQIEEFAQEILGETTDVVFVRSKHPLARRKKVQVSDLQEYTWLIPSDLGETYETVLETFVDEGVPPPNRVIWCDGTGTGFALLLNNDYLILVSPLMMAALIEAKLVVRLDVDRPYRQRKLSLWTRKITTLSPVAAALISDMRAAFLKNAHYAVSPVPPVAPGLSGRPRTK